MKRLSPEFICMQLKSFPLKWKQWKTISGILVFLLLFSCNAEVKPPSSASQFRADAMHSGHYTGTPVSTTPVMKWEFSTGGPVHASAALDDQNLYFGSGDSNFYCLDQMTGTEKWKFKAGGPVYSSAALTDGMVCFGSYDGYFYALNSADGSLKWSFKAAGEKRFSAPGIHGRLPRDSVFQDDWDFFLSSPAIDAGAVFFGTGSGYFYSLDVYTGKENWNYKTGGVIHASPAIALNTVYFGSWDTYMYALDEMTGKVKWKFKTGIDTTIYNQTGMQGSPVYDDSTLYFGCRDSYFYALDAITGKLIWKRYNDMAWVSSCPVLDGDKVIYTTGDSRSLVALNKMDGDSLYRVHTKGWIFSSPSLSGNRIYFGDLNGFLYGFDTESGNLAWCCQLESSRKDQYHILESDSVLNYKVVFSQEMKLQEGRTSLEMIFSLGSVNSSPVIKDGNIFVGSANGKFYAFH